MTIYVLHEYGSNSHYNGLLALCDQYGAELRFYEFRFLHLIGSGIEHRNLQRILKQPKNFAFLINLLFTKGKKVVLGMHPYDSRLPILSFILRNHEVYYHSSYTTWFPEEMKKTMNTSKCKLARIRKFVSQQVKHVFAVTDKAKDSICNFTGIDAEKVSVVYHSFKDELAKKEMPSINTFIYVGRMDVQKGIEEMCEYFAFHPNLILTLVGDGDHVAYVKSMAQKCPNIIYKGFVKGLKSLMPIYNQNAYFILNSKRTEEWEELFGQVICESMACGCVPICVNHSGPKEIIDDGINGFLFDENSFNECMDKVVNGLDLDRYTELREAAYKRGHYFESNKISERWTPIFN